MEAKPESDPAKAAPQKKTAGHLIFGIIAAIVISGLIAMMFAIDEYGESRMPNAAAQAPRDAADH